MTNKEKNLEGQRNRAYAGLHAERKRANSAEKGMAITTFCLLVTTIFAIISFFRN